MEPVRLLRLIKAKEELQTELRARAEKTTRELKEIGKKCGYVESAVEKYGIMLAELKEELAELKVSHRLAESAVLVEISQRVRKEQARGILIRRYIEGQSWSTIASELRQKISRDRIMQLHRQGLKDLGVTDSSEITQELHKNYTSITHQLHKNYT